MRRQPNVNNDNSRQRSNRSAPLPVAVDLTTSRRFEVVVRWSGPLLAQTPGLVTVKQLIDSLPGTSTMWDYCQFQRFDVYGVQANYASAAIPGAANDWPSMTVTLNNTINNNYFGDNPTFYNDAVGGSRRAHVGILPNRLFRVEWLPSSRTETLLTLSTPSYETTTDPDNPLQYAALVQFVVRLRSVAGTAFDAPSSTSVVQAHQDRAQNRAVAASNTFAVCVDESHTCPSSPSDSEALGESGSPPL